MKTSHAVALTISAVLITVAIEETRIASLRSNKATSEPPQITKILRGTEGTASVIPPQASLLEGPPTRRHRAAPESSKKENTEILGKTMREMRDNPAARSMMDQGAKAAALMMYGDFIDSLDLTKEEGDYFQKLLAKQTIDQQGIGMKLLDASPEESEKLIAEMTQLEEEGKQAIKEFLNNETDIKKFENYEERMPERMQMDGIRSAMTEKEMPLTEETEEQVVSAMYKARTESGAFDDINSPEDLEALTSGNAAAVLEQGWAKEQELLRKELTGVLNPTQIQAFFEYKAQMREFQTMGLKMAEQMKPSDKAEAK